MQARPLAAVRPIIVNRQQPEAALLSGVPCEDRKIVTQRRHAAVGLAVVDSAPERSMSRLFRRQRQPRGNRIQVDIGRRGQQAFFIQDGDALVPPFPERSGAIPAKSQVAELNLIG
jgi:hypothetical protein